MSKKSVQRLLAHNTVSGCIVKLFCPEFVICYQSHLISLNRRLFGRRKLGVGDQHGIGSPPPLPFCCFLLVGKYCLNSSDLSQHLPEVRAGKCEPQPLQVSPRAYLTRV